MTNGPYGPSLASPVLDVACGRRPTGRDWRQQVFEEAEEDTIDQKDSKPIETKTAVQKLKSIEGTPPEVVETIEAVREWFDSEMPEATSG
jgi:hypothetical protein